MSWHFYVLYVSKETRYVTNCPGICTACQFAVKVRAADSAKVPNVPCQNRKWGAANSTSASRWALTFQDFFFLFWVDISTFNNPE